METCAIRNEVEALSQFRKLNLHCDKKICDEVVAEINKFARQRVLRFLAGVENDVTEYYQYDSSKEYFLDRIFARVRVNKSLKAADLIRDFLEIMPNGHFDRKPIGVIREELKFKIKNSKLVSLLDPKEILGFGKGIINWLDHEDYAFLDFLKKLHHALLERGVDLNLAIKDPEKFEYDLRNIGNSLTNDRELLIQFIKSEAYQELKMTYLREIDFYLSRYPETSAMHRLLNRRKLELLSLFASFEDRVVTASRSSLNFPSRSYGNRVFFS